MTALEVSAETYHAGVDERPRLSASIAHVLWAKTPLHAWTAHPRLNPYYTRTDDAKFDVGTVAHAILLEGEDCIYTVHEDSWRKNVAKEARDYARSIGKVPLLAAARDEVMAMVDAVREKLDALPDPLFVAGKPEVTLTWTEREVDFKARLDWLRDDYARIVDLKTTSQIDRFERRIFDFGGDIQAATYRRGVNAVFGEMSAAFVWCVVETAPPFELRLIRPGADVLAAGERKLDWAVAKWRECMASGVWPGYSREIVEAELPAWEESRLLEREAREEIAA